VRNHLFKPNDNEFLDFLSNTHIRRPGSELKKLIQIQEANGLLKKVLRKMKFSPKNTIITSIEGNDQFMKIN
jgi:hypothetical protein